MKTEKPKESNSATAGMRVKTDLHTVLGVKAALEKKSVVDVADEILRPALTEFAKNHNLSLEAAS